MTKETDFLTRDAMEDTVEDTLKRLINMTVQTNIMALDKTIAAVQRYPTTTYAAAAARVGSIAERIVRAAQEVGATLQNTSASDWL